MARSKRGAANDIRGRQEVSTSANGEEFAGASTTRTRSGLVPWKGASPLPPGCEVLYIFPSTRLRALRSEGLWRD
jgi:hypothetical protein